MLHDLRIPVFRAVLHGDDDLFGAADDIHRAAHAVELLAGDLPVGKVAVLIDLQCAEHGRIQVAAACNGKRHRAVKAAGTGDKCDDFAAGVAQILVHGLPAAFFAGAAVHPGDHALAR